MPTYNLKCQLCSKDFIASRKHAIFCSKACVRNNCYKNKKPFIKNCAHCNIQFETKRKDTIYCSQGCINTTFKSHEDIELVCEFCKTQFTVKYPFRDRKYCSQHCAGKVNFETRKHVFIKYGEDNPRFGKASWTKGLSAETDERLANLGKKISATSKAQFACGERSNAGQHNPMYGKNHTIETRELMSEMIEKTWSQRKGAHIRGIYFSTKNLVEMKYRSFWELIAMQAFDKDENIVNFISEPFSIKYQRSTEQQNRRYYPDFQIFYKDGSIKVIEIKPKFFMKYEINKSKFENATKYCKEKGFIFEVWHAEEINKLKEMLESGI